MVKRGMNAEQAAQVRARRGNKETKLQKLRVAKGYSQSELAEASGVPKRTIQCYEQETRPIDGARLPYLCDLSIALDCKIEDILESEELIEKFKEVK